MAAGETPKRGVNESGKEKHWDTLSCFIYLCDSALSRSYVFNLLLFLTTRLCQLGDEHNFFCIEEWDMISGSSEAQLPVLLL